MAKTYLWIILFIATMSTVSSLGISPAIKNIAFTPGEEVKITFFVLDTVQGGIYEVHLGGGALAPYSSISTDSVQGSGSFILTIKFPDKIEKPGEHTISVSVKERPSEESFINTVIEVGSIIKVFVPYPGIYGDLALNIPDGNIDNNIPVELHVINRGDNPLDVSSVFIDFITNDGNSVKRLDFTPVKIPVSSDRYFRKYLDTREIPAGNYIGSAKVSYSGIINEVNKSFRVGSLLLNITNFTDYILGSGIQKFYVTLESRWNSPILGAYVDINLSNGLYNTVFRTPSIDLNPWEEKTVESYLDAEELDGSYNLILNATYHGQSTVAYGTLLVGKDYGIVIYGVSAVIAIVFFAVIYFVFGRFIRRKRR